MSMETDRCTYGAHESHNVTRCAGYRRHVCTETTCLDHACACLRCGSVVCLGCMREHNDGACFTTPATTDARR